MAQGNEALARELEAELGTDDTDIDLESDPVAADSKERADRHAWALHYRLAEVAELEALIAQRKAEMDVWLERRTASIQPSITWLKKSLELYGLASNERDPRIKTIELPAGIVIKVSKPRGTVDVRDPEGFMAWANSEDHLALNLINEPPPPAPKPALKEIAKLARSPQPRSGFNADEYDFLLDGEVIPGVAFVVPKQNTVSVKVAGATTDEEES